MSYLKTCLDLLKTSEEISGQQTRFILFDSEIKTTTESIQILAARKQHNHAFLLDGVAFTKNIYSVHI